MLLQNVVIITNQASTMGGAEKVACRCAILMAERGFNTYLFAGTGPVSPELVQSGVHVTCLDGEYTAAAGRNKIVAAAQGFWNAKAGRVLSRLLAGLDPASTVVNLHSWTHTMSSSILESVRRAGFPLLITAHDYFLACPNGGFYNYVDWKPCELRECGRECRRTNCDKRSFAQKKYRVARFDVQTRILRKMKPKPGVIFLSDFSEGVLRESVPFECDSYRIDNPIDSGNAARVDSPSFADRSIDCLFVGRVEPEKDCALFCRVATKVGCRAVVVGDGAQRPELERDFPEVEFVGKRFPREVAEYYRNSRVFVFSSSYYEVAPLTIREAQLAGALPVALRGGTAGTDYVRDGVDGIVAPYDDEDALVSAVRGLLDEGTNDRMRRAVLDADFSVHNGSVFADRMNKIYESFLSSRGVDR